MDITAAPTFPIPEGARPVIIATKHRGVFFGYTTDPDTATIVTLYSLRCGIKWGTTGGFLQLAGTGPTKASKIGARAPKATLQDVTAVVDVTVGAAEAWEVAT